MINCTFENGGKASLRHVVVHAIVEKDGKLLLVKRADRLLEGGKWSLPSGFLNRDETAPQGILRELKEETGWDGEVVSMFRINTDPNRPHEDRQNIAIDYIIRPLEQTGQPDDESSDIDWVSIEKIITEELAFDHGETISLYKNYKENNHLLPLAT